jgi:cell division protein FtsL
VSAPPKRTRPRLERDRPRLTGRAAALLVAVSVLVVMAVVPARQLLEQRGRIAEVDRQAAALEAENDELRREISALHDPVHLERLARACLGMVASGEVAFVIAGKPAANDC